MSVGAIQHQVLCAAWSRLLDFARATLGGTIEGRVAAGQLDDGRVYLHAEGHLFTFVDAEPVDGGEYELHVPALN